MTNPNAITVTEGEIVYYVFTVMRAGAVVDISGDTVTLYVHDSDPAVPFGTNKVNGGAVTFVTDGTDGQFTYEFTSADTTFVTDRDFLGVWAAKIVDAGGGIEWTKQEPFRIVRNPFIVEGT
jgi:hypothetical protein